MSKHHQASRRRSYGRRQHEVRERIDRRAPRHADPPEVGDGALVLEEPRHGSVHWAVSVWAGLR